MRCARPDQSTCTITLHYLSNGTLRLRVSIRKQEMMIPLCIILKALQPGISDRVVYAQIIGDSGGAINALGAPQVERACLRFHTRFQNVISSFVRHAA